ncbi:hypothetical protein O181_002862 [Austropuccinia psidii MF-1]|uniref:DUF8040 domain-containing protein n=1 Tax=Austropuccinia psidii MF-1 TaxID=1389203 RepID=A0A9Q3BD97_9BASI|nr:hypothetical protein [Austropuccinia psidii MF-1]
MLWCFHLTWYEESGHQHHQAIKHGRHFNPWYKGDLYNENLFIGLLRMGRLDFFQLIRALLNHIPSSFQDDMQGLTIEEKVGITLYRMGHGSSYETVGHVFNMGKATAYQALKEVVQAILVALYDSTIMFPAAEEIEKWDAIKKTFQQRQGLTNIIGAIDGTHIPIIPQPNDQWNSYVNRKG